MLQDFCLFPSTRLAVYMAVWISLTVYQNRTEGFKLPLYLPSFLRYINRNSGPSKSIHVLQSEL